LAVVLLRFDVFALEGWVRPPPLALSVTLDRLGEDPCLPINSCPPPPARAPAPRWTSSPA
jgi:hypothetical protein